jgi:Arc/MetJ-type ribon-helix-helix transcriptional regulator
MSGALLARRLAREGMMIYHISVAKTKIAVTVDAEILTRVDELVKQRAFANRSQAVEGALRDTIERVDRTRLAHACAQLDAYEEAAFADADLAGALDTWPAY